MEPKHEGAMEAAVGVMGVLTAGGVLTFALFPLMLPTVVLLAVLALPLLVPVVLAAILAGIFVLVRRLLRKARPRVRAEAPVRRPNSLRRPPAPPLRFAPPPE
jgi:hypothetical protein